MGAAGGRTENSIADRLMDEAWDFDFFQAVRLLMRVLPERAPVGRDAKPSEEVVRFGSHVTLEFPASAIHEVVRSEREDGAPHMTVAFMGLMGVNGVLPLHYTEWMVLRSAAKDTSMAAFFDIFNHRWLSLFYNAWEKHRLAVTFERSQLETKRVDRLTDYLFDFVGLGTGGLKGRLCVRDETFLLYAGLVAQRPRSASALRGVLRDYFGVPVEIEQCIGGWYELEEGDRSYLTRESLSNQLGVGAIAGDMVWDQQSCFRIRIGPVGYKTFREFLPGERATAELTDLVRFLLGPTLVFDIQLVLAAAEVPAFQLAERLPQLGWDSWLSEGGLPEDAGDAIFAEAA